MSTTPKGRPTLLAALVLAASATASAQSLEDAVTPLVRESCVRCHGVRTVTPLSLLDLGYDLTDHKTFRAWERVYERLERGEMPPSTVRQPESAVVETALASLKQALTDANLKLRGGQRTSLRRLTRLEYGYTVADLLQMDEAIGAELATLLPAEADSGGFDTVAANQSMSPLHVQSYLAAADRALDAALVVGPPPAAQHRVIDYTKSQVLAALENCDFLACGAILRQDDGFATFSDISATFMFHSLSEGFAVAYPGRYRVSLEGYPFQADTPVTMALYRGSRPGAAASLDELIGQLDVVGEETGTLTVTPFLRPGDLVAPTLADHDTPPGDSPDGYFVPERHVRDYTGEGVVMKSMTIEGPLFDTWPPPSTRALLTGVTFDADGEVVLSKAPYDHIVEIVDRFARRAFRRSLGEGELEAYASLAEPLLADGRGFVEAVRVPLRAILSAPPFLYHATSPGELDDFALATRLSYFLWRSMPDDVLLARAGEGRLSDPTVLAAEVERMLDDPRTDRFVRDFAGQAFRLYELRATSPDPGLYPEYDDRLAQAMEQETQLFLAELVAADEPASSVVDADFTFLNRRLAEHYGIEGVEGQQMRRVELPADSPRGGLITQASVHKITSNGTTTSPIPRGNFVLANLLGRPAPPPPAAVDIPEPDTRGTTTIREQLDAHRASPVCANCHRTIDPPGFALESFDPIGGFREQYRVSGRMAEFEGNSFPAPYKQGPPVDASGVTPQGAAFSGIQDYQRLLVDTEMDQVARHLASQLVILSTGAEIEFADRDGIERILDAVRDQGYPVRRMIHEVVKSDLFRSN
jgi:hypothetical protein